MQIALLDDMLGRIDALIYGRTLCSGSLIAYNIEHRNNRYYIDSIEVLSIPLFIARTNLAFLHYILELCFYSIPVGSYAKEVFELIVFLIQEKEVVYIAATKKLLLGKLFYLLGVHSEYPVSNNPDILPNFLLLSIDKMKDKSLNLECEKELDVWLKRCITEHPWYSHFKTIRFLD